MARVEWRRRTATSPPGREIANLYDITRFDTLAFLDAVNCDVGRISGGRVLTMPTTMCVAAFSNCALGVSALAASTAVLVETTSSSAAVNVQAFICYASARSVKVGRSSRAGSVVPYVVNRPVIVAKASQFALKLCARRWRQERQRTVEHSHRPLVAKSC